ncbi:hypothetical protein [Extensimonas vulgaris]|uniref:Uncharacterized protein n=1 Tax=Extensimonas vulgaris TaxID=1031594 RepID=A0A369AT95_9BURK|nr:hypothetical protein [Extensimonas vulgaris]RCX10694.1 hypothetical protein DFR45_10295 [Extensimonas vulgaris]TWI41336.1 hypothetical protein IP95_00093 [Extensimonas vulgaris]TXD16805.1 hypothetical protein FUT63_02100 [Extensimonas vulgaris]
MAIKNKNFWVSALSVAATATDTTLYIPTGDAANLPALSAGNTTRLVLPVTDGSGAETDWEIVEVTAYNTSTGALTVTRGAEGTIAKPWPIGNLIDMRVTAGMLDGVGVPPADFGGTAISNYTDDTASITVTGATTTIDLASTKARVISLAMQANTTLAFANVPSNGVVAITLICTQDATGGRTLTFPGGTKFPGGSVPTLSTTANAEDWFELVKPPLLTNWRVFTVGKKVS